MMANPAIPTDIQDIPATPTMDDEPRHFPVVGPAQDYAFLADDTGHVRYESDDSDDSDRPLILPNIEGEDVTDDHLINGPSSRPLTLTRAGIPHIALADRFTSPRFTSARITTDTTPRPSRINLAPTPPAAKNDWEPGEGPMNPPASPPPLSYNGIAADTNGVARQIHRLHDSSSRPPVLRRRDTLYEEFLRQNVSALVNRTPLRYTSFPMIQLSCVDEARHILHRHHVLIQSSFYIPGFAPQTSRRELYKDDRGWQQPYSVYIPYLHRRLWLCLLTAPPGHTATNPKSNAVVAYQATRLFRTALSRHKLGIHSVHSRRFSRRVSHALKRDDVAWGYFGTTSFVRFALDFYVEARRRYLSAREDNASLPLYADSHSTEAQGDDVYRNAQKAVDRWITVVDTEERALAEGVVVDPGVEVANCPESDRDEEANTLRARSRRGEFENMPESDSDEEMGDW